LAPASAESRAPGHDLRATRAHELEARCYNGRMKTVVLSLSEKQARLVRQSIRSTRDHMASDIRHEDDRKELRAVETMLDAEMQVSRATAGREATG